MSPGIKTRLLGTQSDERLVGLVRGGYEHAFEALVHRYRRPLLRYCHRLCASEARAEEALQQALLNAWVALRRDTEIRDVRAWLYGIAHNAAVDSMRTERAVLSEAEIGDRSGRRVAALTAAAGASHLDDVLALRDAFASIAALPEMQREAIVRTAVGGDSHEEVASALGISDGAVRGLLHRARCTLRAGLTALTPAPLLAWAAGGPSPAAGERIAELAAGGGAAGLGGIAAKGGVLAITAGMAIAGSVIAGHHGDVGRRDLAPANGGRRAETAAPDGYAGAIAPRAEPLLAMLRPQAASARRGAAGTGDARRARAFGGCGDPRSGGCDGGGGGRQAGGRDRSPDVAVSPRTGSGDGGLLGAGGEGSSSGVASSSGDQSQSSDGGSAGSSGGSSSSSSTTSSSDGGGQTSGTTSSSDGGSQTSGGSSVSSDGGGGTSDGGALSSGGGSLSSGGGSLESQSSDGKSSSLEPESQLQSSSGG